MSVAMIIRILVSVASVLRLMLSCLTRKCCSNQENVNELPLKLEIHQNKLFSYFIFNSIELDLSLLYFMTRYNPYNT